MGRVLSLFVTQRDGNGQTHIAASPYHCHLRGSPPKNKRIPAVQSYMCTIIRVCMRKAYLL